MICPMNSLATVGGLSTGPATSPRWMSVFDIPLTFMPMLSPGSATGIEEWCISIDLTSPVLFEGMKTTDMPALSTPVSTLPTGTVPIPVML